MQSSIIACSTGQSANHLHHRGDKLTPPWRYLHHRGDPVYRLVLGGWGPRTNRVGVSLSPSLALPTSFNSNSKILTLHKFG